MRSTKTSGTPYKLAIVAPTCFYYQVALFQTLAAHPMIDLTVYFCSEESLHGEDVRQTFETDGDWGMGEELLRGYKYKFLRNFSPRPSYLRWPYGLMNFGIWDQIKNERPDAVVLMSWTNLTWWLAILACLFFKIPYFYMTDANVISEIPKRRWWRWIKKVTLGKVVFRWASGFLCAGTANRQIYKLYDVPEEKLVAFAYSWGYQSLLQDAGTLKAQRNQFRAELGIPENSRVILYCGRLSLEKNPSDLLDAYRRISLPDTSLIFVGDGKLKQSLEQQAARHNLDSVYFFGFKDRKELPKYYAISDVLVLPSHRETWGMVVNEAMCFGLPVIVSDQVGAGVDLVRYGYNGFSFPGGDTDALGSRLQQFIELPETEKELFGIRSEQLVREWADRDLAQILSQYLEWINDRESPIHGRPDSVGR